MISAANDRRQILVDFARSIDSMKQPRATYLALVDVPDENIPKHYRGKVAPGMNVEVIMPTIERTALHYFLLNRCV